MDRLMITTFTDPMMGLTYECEPIYDKLKENYPQIEFRWVMSLLVRDISDFMLPNETIAQYNKRLARIYESEQSIGGLPISMPDLHLFDEQHRSSLPLNLAYKAAQLADIDRADEFLKNLRHVTIVDVLPTTHFDVILKVVRDTGIDEDQFTQYYNDGTAQTMLEHDLNMLRKLNIRTLPVYMIQYGERSVIIRNLISYESFVEIIEQLKED
ncbi:DsbA family protein [Ruminococcus sp.]|uniref:DsbA family protein n=1 Tax=Ruminococcus sp. TaxID=41978 RepID=UPI0025E1EC42|nr:DsbA family protein [Ruminococcus sp.]MBQ8964998.1 DsbA family protein [Ruminococcus sp.]